MRIQDQIRDEVVRDLLNEMNQAFLKVGNKPDGVSYGELGIALCEFAHTAVEAINIQMAKARIPDA